MCVCVCVEGVGRKGRVERTDNTPERERGRNQGRVRQFTLYAAHCVLCACVCVCQCVGALTEMVKVLIQGDCLPAVAPDWKTL